LIDLEFLKKGERVIKVKAGFDTNAIFTCKNIKSLYSLAFDDCYIWGGENLSAYGITNFEKP
jgi:hypothetical protein